MKTIGWLKKSQKEAAETTWQIEVFQKMVHLISEKVVELRKLLASYMAIVHFDKHMYFDNPAAT